MLLRYVGGRVRGHNVAVCRRLSNRIVEVYLRSRLRKPLPGRRAVGWPHSSWRKQHDQDAVGQTDWSGDRVPLAVRAPGHGRSSRYGHPQAALRAGPRCPAPLTGQPELTPSTHHRARRQCLGSGQRAILSSSVPPDWTKDNQHQPTISNFSLSRRSCRLGGADTSGYISAREQPF